MLDVKQPAFVTPAIDNEPAYDKHFGGKTSAGILGDRK